MTDAVWTKKTSELVAKRREILSKRRADGKLNHVVDDEFVHEWFPTPPGLVQAFMPHLDLRDGLTLLEPGAGRGDLLGELRNGFSGWSHVTAVEIDPQRREVLEPLADEVIVGDFLAVAPSLPQFDRVVTNPPFSIWVEFTAAAIDLCKPGGIVASVGRLGLMESNGRESFWNTYRCDAWVCPWRNKFVDNDSSPTEGHCVYFFRPGEQPTDATPHTWHRLVRPDRHPSLFDLETIDV